MAEESEDLIFIEDCIGYLKMFNWFWALVNVCCRHLCIWFYVILSGIRNIFALWKSPVALTLYINLVKKSLASIGLVCLTNGFLWNMLVNGDGFGYLSFSRYRGQYWNLERSPLEAFIRRSKLLGMKHHLINKTWNMKDIY